MGFTNLNFKKSNFRIQFYQNPRFRDKILTIQSLKIPCDSYKIHTQSSFHTLLLDLGFLSSSSLLLPLPLLLSFPLYRSLYLETKLVLNPMFAKSMFGPPKTHFWVKFHYLKKGPSMFDYLFQVPKIVFWHIVSSIYDF